MEIGTWDAKWFDSFPALFVEKEIASFTKSGIFSKEGWGQITLQVQGGVSLSARHAVIGEA